MSNNRVKRLAKALWMQSAAVCTVCQGAKWGVTMRFRSFGTSMGLVLLFGWLTGAAALSQGAQALPDSTYVNPLGPQIPDPFVLRAEDGMYYAYGTTGFRAWSSPDLVKWKAVGNVYQKTANSWGTGSFWAPEVVEYQGKYYMYYTADNAAGSKRIGVAIGDRPTGPFIDPYARPLFEPGYGVIDPHVLLDEDGRKYLYYSRAMSENDVGGSHESHIYVIELGDDMVSVRGTPVLLTRPEQAWERMSGPQSYWNEGAAVFKHNGIYYLMWSANSYAGRQYAVGFATSTDPMGPFVKSPLNPVLSAAEWGARLSGPGHNSVIRSIDDAEWFIAYHTHIDPVVGGGRRQLNIDRMGFRADGSLYVNGPSLTPQPMPSGTTEWRNIAGDATVTASSTEPGSWAYAVVDGEIGFDPRFARYDWVSNGAGSGAWVQLTWAQERRLKQLFLYDSALAARKIKRGHVLFSDGTVVNDVVFPPEPGAAAIVPAPDNSIKWVKFVVDEMADTGAPAALSEIVAQGYPLGEEMLREAWISSPQPGTTVQTRTPIRIDGAEDVSAVWTVLLDDTVIYEGNSFPADLTLQPAALSPGWHLLLVRAASPNNQTATLASSFAVEHLRISIPPGGDMLRGEATITTQLALESADVERVAVSVFAADNAGNQAGKAVQTVYAGEALPPQIKFDTYAFADGSYDLRFEWWTKAGVHALLSRSIMIDNWDVLDDPLESPTDGGWFGVVERDLTTERSPGWVYATDNSAEFAGDADRLRRAQPDVKAYLVWNQPGLYSFTAAAFAQEPGMVQRLVSVSVSADGQNWVPIEFTASFPPEDGPRNAATQWRKVLLTGTVPPDIAANYLRLELNALNGTESDLQLGHVSLVERR